MLRLLITFVTTVLVTAQVHGQQPAATPDPADPIRTLVSRLDLEKYKATVKGLTQFGDRRQGTDRNRAAIDWIEAQLKSYGCTNTERLKYTFEPPPPNPNPNPAARPPADASAIRTAQGGGTRAACAPQPVSTTTR